MDGDGGYGDGGASQFAGGGFMPPSTPQPGISGGGSPFSPRGRRSNTSVVYPFTIRQLAKCYSETGGDTLAVNGQEINNVVVVGKVLSLESRTTDMQLLLDDGTGRMEIRKWHDDQAPEQDPLSNIQTDSVVKVHGVPRKIGNTHTISAGCIRPIVDFNEYTCHFLDCIFAHQYSKATQGPTAAPSPQQPASGAQQPAVGGTHAAGAAAGGGAESFVPSDPRLPRHERVLKFFADNEAGDPSGLHRDTVARNVNGASPQQVIDAIDFLIGEGHLYSTIDEVHFRTLGEQG